MNELLPIVLGVAVCGRGWKGLSVLCLCDNTVVVAIVNCDKSRAMHSMRCLSIFLAKWGESLLCRHIPGTQNGAADALSRDNLPLFQKLVPEASAVPAELPDNLLQCLVLGTPDWTRVDIGYPYFVKGLVHKQGVCLWPAAIHHLLHLSRAAGGAYWGALVSVCHQDG